MMSALTPVTREEMKAFEADITVRFAQLSEEIAGQVAQAVAGMGNTIEEKFKEADDAFKLERERVEKKMTDMQNMIKTAVLGTSHT